MAEPAWAGFCIRMSKYSKSNQEIAQLFYKTVEGKWIWERETKSYWSYVRKQGIWELVDDDMLERKISAFVQAVDKSNPLTMHKIRDIGAQIKHYCDNTDSLDADYLAFSDGSLSLEDFSFKDHSPKNIAYVYLDFPFKELKEAKSPIFDKYLKTTCTDLYGKYNETMAIQLQEIAGFVLSNERAEKAFICVGNGANGKSPYLDILRALVGFERCHAASLSDLTTKSFELCDLVGKRLNAKSEDESEKIRLSVLKELISNEPVKTRRLYGSNFNFRVKCKFVMSSNSVIRMEGIDDAMRRRLMFIPFENKIDESRADRNIGRKMTKNELPAIVRWALGGVRRIKETNCKFTTSNNSEKAMYEFVASNNSALDFIMSEYEEGCGNVPVPMTKIYAHYLEWCRENGRKAMSSNRVSREISTVMGLSKEQTIDGKRCACYDVRKKGTAQPKMKI